MRSLCQCPLDGPGGGKVTGEKLAKLGIHMVGDLRRLDRSALEWSFGRYGLRLHELARGKDAAKLTRKLASRRADKPNPLYYAQRTVDVASARLWLIEGVPIDDVVTQLEVRRRFEIPVALCRARAREIAQTAQRMIARRRIA